MRSTVKKLPGIAGFIVILFIIVGPAAGQEMKVMFNERIEMSDGVELSATVWRPAEQDTSLPAVVSFTPYISDAAQEHAKTFVKADYVYVSVDVRGRGNSEGKFGPLEETGKDGAAAINWVSEQSWCDGRVVTRGGSYRGMMQWKVMGQDPPALKASVPTASVYPGHDYPNPKGIFMSYAARWLGYTSGRTDNDKWFGNNTYWKKKYEKLYKNYWPFRKLGELTGTNNEAFQKWLDHPTYDKYWEGLAPTPAQYAEIDHPVLTITGYFDGDQPGALRYYREHLRQADSAARTNHHLLAGPYSHGGTRSPQRELGGFSFGSNAVIDMDKLHVKWFNWILRDSTKPELLKDRVTYYTMGSNEWNYAASLPQMSTDTLIYYLSSPDRNAKDVFNSGYLLKNPSEHHHTTQFTYDPLDTSAAESYLEHRREPYLSEHQAFQDEHLIFHSKPLQDSVQLSGQIELKTYLSLNVPDTDVAAYLYAILPDGQSLYLGRDKIRTRYGNDWSRRLNVEPGTVYPYWFDAFYLMSRSLPEGTRFRLVLGPLNTPDWQKNYNSGGPISEQTGNDAQTAELKLHHGPKYSTQLILPVK